MGTGNEILRLRFASFRMTCGLRWMPRLFFRMNCKRAGLKPARTGWVGLWEEGMDEEGGERQPVVRFFVAGPPQNDMWV